MGAINPKTIDELRALQAGGSPTFLGELIDLFLKELAQNMARLREALAGRDARAVERVAHTMKGSCGNLGAETLSALCAELHAAARTGDWARAEPLAARIEQEQGAVAAALEAEKSKPA